MAFGIIEEGNMYVGLCIHLKSPLPLSAVPAAGHRLQVASKVTRHLVVETGAGHMLRLLWKAVFPVRQAYVRAKSCCYIGWTRLLYCCQRLLSSSADIWDGDCAKLKDGAKFASSLISHINVAL